MTFKNMLITILGGTKDSINAKFIIVTLIASTIINYVIYKIVRGQIDSEHYTIGVTVLTLMILMNIKINCLT